MNIDERDFKVVELSIEYGIEWLQNNVHCSEIDRKAKLFCVSGMIYALYGLKLISEIEKDIYQERLDLAYYEGMECE